MKNFINKIVEQAKDLEREASLSDTDWVQEQWDKKYEIEDEIAKKDQWCAKQLILQ